MGIPTPNYRLDELHVTRGVRVDIQPRFPILIRKSNISRLHVPVVGAAFFAMTRAALKITFGASGRRNACYPLRSHVM